MKSIKQVRIECDKIATRTNKLKLGKRDAVLLRKAIAELDGLRELTVEYNCLFGYRLANTPRTRELSLDPAVVTKMALDAGVIATENPDEILKNAFGSAEAPHPNKDLQDAVDAIKERNERMKKVGTIIEPSVK